MSADSPWTCLLALPLASVALASALQLANWLPVNARQSDKQTLKGIPVQQWVATNSFVLQRTKNTRLTQDSALVLRFVFSPLKKLRCDLRMPASNCIPSSSQSHEAATNFCHVKMLLVQDAAAADQDTHETRLLRERVKWCSASSSRASWPPLRPAELELRPTSSSWTTARAWLASA